MCYFVNSLDCNCDDSVNLYVSVGFTTVVTVTSETILTDPDYKLMF